MTYDTRNRPTRMAHEDGFTGLVFDRNDIDETGPYPVLYGCYAVLLQDATRILTKLVASQPVTAESPYYLVEARNLLRRLYGDNPKEEASYRGFIISEYPWKGYWHAQHKDFDYTEAEGGSHPTFQGHSKAECIEQVDEWYEDNNAST